MRKEQIQPRKNRKEEIDRQVNLNYGKGYIKNILELLCVCGSIPYKAFRYLPETRQYQRACYKLLEAGIIVDDNKGGYRNIRLSGEENVTRIIKENLGLAYLSYYETSVRDSIKELTKENSGRPETVRKKAMTKIYMYAAGVEIHPQKKNIYNEKIEKEDKVTYYDSVELKNVENYDVEIRKEEGNLKVQYSRIKGLLISPGGYYGIYNVGNTLGMWRTFGEIKMAYYINNLIRHKLSDTIQPPKEKEAIIITESGELIKELCIGKVTKNNEVINYDIDDIYDCMYTLIENEQHLSLLKIMTYPNWKEEIYKRVIAAKERENVINSQTECDGYDQEKDVYKFVFCIPDIIRFRRFVRRGLIEKNREKYIVYCFECQLPYVTSICGNDFKILKMNEEKCYNDVFVNKAIKD